MSTDVSGISTTAAMEASHRSPTQTIGTANAKEMPRGTRRTSRHCIGTAGRCLSYGSARLEMQPLSARGWKASFEKPLHQGRRQIGPRLPRNRNKYRQNQEKTARNPKNSMAENGGQVIVELATLTTSYGRVKKHKKRRTDRAARSGGGQRSLSLKIQRGDSRDSQPCIG